VRKILPIALLAALLVAGCGGKEDDGRAKSILRQAFSNAIGSANLDVRVSADLDADDARLKQPLRLTLSGPYQSNGNGKLPDADWDVSISGGGQAFTLGLLTTADEAFVNFQGTSYTLGRDAVRRIEGGGTRNGGLAERLGVKPLDWVRDAKVEDDATVAGVPTRHVSAKLDVGETLRGLNAIVRRAGSSLPAGAAQLTVDQIEGVRRNVDDPRMDVYVGKEDGKVRRLSVDVEFDVPENRRALVGGLKGGTVTFDVELSAVGRPQRVEPPADARPIAELTSQLGGLGVLGALFGRKPPGGAGGGGSRGTPPSAEQFDRYRECLDKAKPSDQAAIDQCAALLR
jgi:hypothetical protein